MTFGSARPIQSYGPRGYRIDDKLYPGPCLVMPSGVQPWSGLGDMAAILALQGEIDIILLGTGRELLWPQPDFRCAIEAAGFGLEVMSSPSACRSYNVMLAEVRPVAAALLPIVPG